MKSIVHQVAKMKMIDILYYLFGSGMKSCEDWDHIRLRLTKFYFIKTPMEFGILCFNHIQKSNLFDKLHCVRILTYLCGIFELHPHMRLIKKMDIFRIRTRKMFINHITFGMNRTGKIFQIFLYRATAAILILTLS